MRNKELTFAIAFIVTITVLMYFLGVSITGYVAQSMYCQYGECKEFCRFNSDCIIEGQECCQEEDFGICEYAYICEQPYVFEPGDVEIQPLAPHSEIPGAFTSGLIGLYTLFIVVAVLIGVIYFLQNKR